MCVEESIIQPLKLKLLIECFLQLCLASVAKLSSSSLKMSFSVRPADYQSRLAVKEAALKKERKKEKKKTNLSFSQNGQRISRSNKRRSKKDPRMDTPFL